MQKRNKTSIIKSIRFMIDAARIEKQLKILLYTFLLTISTVIVSLVTLYISPLLIETVSNNNIKDFVIIVIVFSLLLFIFNGCIGFLEHGFLLEKVAIRSRVIAMITNKQLTTSYSNLTDENFNTLLSKTERAIANSQSSSEAIWEHLAKMLISVLLFISYIVIMTKINVLIILFIIITSVISFYLNKYFRNYIRRHIKEEARSYRHNKYLNNISKNVSFKKEMEIFGLKSWINSLSEATLASSLLFYHKASLRVFFGSLINIIFTFLRNALAYYYLITLIYQNQISISEFVLLFTCISSFASNIDNVLLNYGVLQKDSIDLGVVCDFINYQEPYSLNEGIRINKEELDKFEIELRNVSFKYPNSDKYILKDINLTLHDKEKLAVIGVNGAGKTTLAKIMCGMLDATSGEVLFNGIDIKKYNRLDYYNIISAVFQEYKLLPTSISENIGYNGGEIDLDKVKDAISKAGLTQKIESLEKGYNTNYSKEVYEDGVEFSGGEKQRLILARAIYKDGPILFLDEPTASLDSISEKNLYLMYSEHLKNKTSLFISHRLISTIFCDRIILIEDGKIIEEGTHLELLKLDGSYKKLFDTQAKYYVEDENYEEL